jgi:DNA polymerase III delta prime subunit
VVILDEADYLNPQSTQPALRGFIEEFSSNCRFILTCNFKNRIIEPLHSRCSVIEFAMPKKERDALAGMFMQRVQQILAVESINSDPAVLAELIIKYFPDFRRTLNELQRYSNFGKIDSGILASATDISLDTLMSSLKIKNFKQMRQWVADNIDTEPAAMFRKIYDNMNEFVEPQSIPQLVLILADYQYKNSFVADHELNMVACLTEVMAGVKFK